MIIRRRDLKRDHGGIWELSTGFRPYVSHNHAASIRLIEYTSQLPQISVRSTAAAALYHAMDPSNPATASLTALETGTYNPISCPKRKALSREWLHISCPRIRDLYLVCVVLSYQSHKKEGAVHLLHVASNGNSSRYSFCSFPNGQTRGRPTD